ncbi:hypothetical protein GCM10007169_16440 [Shewanella fodinae]|nr:hypothetical protein GCM10007169_16440 [Shewanella fodinae]
MLSLTITADNTTTHVSNKKNAFSAFYANPNDFALIAAGLMALAPTPQTGERTNRVFHSLVAVP